ncbi:sulfite exporter TauE/SafE family protein [Candidatus Uhrbacteria bacterium]|nr:sulfite exporter TauE/SafE family protein [Candidatus Uhrbacteria bacterium]
MHPSRIIQRTALLIVLAMMLPVSALAAPWHVVITRMTEERSLWLLPCAFVAGMVSVATPCVLPMLPITLGTLGVRSDTTRRITLLRTLAYIGGILVTFMGLGMLAGIAGNAVSTIFTYTSVHLVLAAVFLILALSTFGVYTLQLPSALQTRWSRIGGASIFGAFAAGTVGGLLALPCTGPVLAGILGVIGSAGSAMYGALILGCYALGFGMPFLALGIGLIRMPKTRTWTQRTEYGIGALLLIGAFWMLRNAFPDIATPFAHPAAFLPALGLIAIGSATLIWTASLSTFAVVRGVGGITLGGVLVMSGLAAPTNTDWCEEGRDGACLATACAAHPITVVDAHAPWCTSCRTLERETLAAPSVQQAIGIYGRVRIDVDAHPQHFDRFAPRGLPAITFLDRTCTPVHGVTGLIPPAQLLDHLRRAEILVQ